MDPNACMERLIEAAADRDHDEVIAAARDLRNWVQNSGFLPHMDNQRWWELLNIISDYAHDAK